ncbi:MAG: HAD-IIIC family phosphatase [Magnetococcales bacterium]|nr:HAD-IIIC family phosphatase [Magnetococcales bacterium]
MNFLEARKILATPLDDLPVRRLLLGGSGMLDGLTLFLRAQAATRRIRLEPETLPFGTLIQSLVTLPTLPDRQELYLLLPWDLIPECDWRTGNRTLVDEEGLLAEAMRRMELVTNRPGARIAWLPAPMPPLLPNHAASRSLTGELLKRTARQGALLLDARDFSLAGYLASGQPIAGSRLGTLAGELLDWLSLPPAGSIKVIVTDLDHTLWRGIVGEDGPDGVSAAPEAASFRHFLFQALLKRLKSQGLLLAAVTRNDEDLARAPFKTGRMPLTEEDFVAFRAGYGAKSTQIRHLATTLNLGLDAFLFVDDNPVELAEVRANLPQVVFLQFPGDEEGFPHFLDRIAWLASRHTLTAEDGERTALYHRMLADQPPPESGGAPLTAFLRGLAMVLTIREPQAGARTRAHQLINKTNQFNLNGIRFGEEEMEAILAAGGRLFVATLEDRSGSHGEILSCLVDTTGRVRSLVISCRVLQRRVEYVFLACLIERWQGPPLILDFLPTERNAPLRLFLEDPAFVPGEEGVRLDPAAFREAHAGDCALFTIRESP